MRRRRRKGAPPEQGEAPDTTDTTPGSEDEGGEPPRRERELPERTLRKRAQRAETERLTVLVERIVALPERSWRALELPESIHETLARARRMRPSAARNRELLYAVGRLRVEDAEAVAAAVAAACAPATPPAPGPAEAWRERLLREGDTALAELLDASRPPDPTRLRQLLRNAAREQRAGAEGGRAQEQLLRALRDLLERG